MKKGFTLAEVLITLGIIGVVAALTMPALVSNYKKNVAETRLKKFYSNINQAVKLSEIDNGPADTWQMPSKEHSDEGGAEEFSAFYNKYLAKYLKNLSDPIEGYAETGDKGGVESYTANYIFVKFIDGSALRMGYAGGGMDMVFFPEAKNVNSEKNISGKDAFVFSLNKSESKNQKNSVEPYTFNWDGTVEHLTSHPRYGCTKDGGHFCTKLIQMNGWQIPKDYPIKF